MTWENSAITITTLLPIVGALVIVCDAEGEGSAGPRSRDRRSRRSRWCWRSRSRSDSTTDRGGLQYVLERPWIAAIGARYHVGDRRHLDAAVRPDVPALVPVRDLHLALRARARPHEGVPGADAAARDRHGGHVHRVRPDPVLRVLGAGPGPDVLPDRGLGIGEPRVRLDQVLPVHAVRVGVHAAGLPRPVLQRPRTRAHVRHRAAHASSARTAGSATRSSWSCSAAIALGFAVKVPMWPFHTWLPDAHTEAPDDRLGAAGRDHAEDGDVRLHPDRDPDPARGRAGVRAVDRRRSRRSRSSTRRSRVWRRRT